MAIRIFITGGTFDKEYNELNGDLYFKDTHMHEMLKLGRCQLAVQIRTLMMVDSMELTDEDRQIIALSCKRAKEEHIVVTHGTDTMVKTAEVIASSVTDKTVILTGAMIPYAFGSSDGLFNLGATLAFVQALPHGVYISMNGNIYNWDNVVKNRQLGVFEKIDPLKD